MSLPVSFGADAKGEALAFDGTLLTVISPRPFAPGAPLELAITITDQTAMPVMGKSLGSKRRDDGRFDLRVRTISLRRELRDALIAALASA